MKLYDFNPGSNKPLLHLAHANGFLPQTYQKALEPLLPHYHAVSIPARPLWGDTLPEWLKQWSQMADDLVEGIKNLTTPSLHPSLLKGEGDSPQKSSPLAGEGRVRGEKIIGVGHSLGGVLTLYAAVKHPEFFSRVVLIDPTMLSPKLLWQIKIFKLFGFEARSFLIKGALRRKRDWESSQAAYEYFRGRQLFKNWSDDMVRTYTESITTPSPQGGVYLTYPPEWEAQIYKTIPTDVWKFAKRLQQPTLVIRGENSNTFTADSEKAFRKANPKAVIKVIQGAGHLVPQEKPEEVGRLINEFLLTQTF